MDTRLLAERDLFMCAISLMLLRTDLSRSPPTSIMAAGIRSNTFDALSGISYQRECAVLYALGIRERLSDAAVRQGERAIRELIEFAFVHGYPDWAAEATNYLDQIGPLRP